ncbi:hypothetical protein PPERSA_01085 [Pseudocohnilembus persalinus]|uniref:Uncharacterized protein n=1 Tax=Pseudocohnilembus persalinus TaxID=266149 RepID=A0A0V0QUT1_PSEPJ|nr:hypothetical protein PPERSA_01085 [Pseudocohnilembus persalinus]|eukprot:KRX06007.1 hypothetical protein PPERSA_01085 [Pseudocohnilembus persalinus]
MSQVNYLTLKDIIEVIENYPTESEKIKMLEEDIIFGKQIPEQCQLCQCFQFESSIQIKKHKISECFLFRFDKILQNEQYDNYNIETDDLFEFFSIYTDEEFLCSIPSLQIYDEVYRQKYIKLNFPQEYYVNYVKNKLDYSEKEELFFYELNQYILEKNNYNESQPNQSMLQSKKNQKNIFQQQSLEEYENKQNSLVSQKKSKSGYKYNSFNKFTGLNEISNHNQTIKEQWELGLDKLPIKKQISQDFKIRNKFQNHNISEQEIDYNQVIIEEEPLNTIQNLDSQDHNNRFQNIINQQVTNQQKQQSTRSLTQISQNRLNYSTSSEIHKNILNSSRNKNNFNMQPKNERIFQKDLINRKIQSPKFCKGSPLKNCLKSQTQINQNLENSDENFQKSELRKKSMKLVYQEGQKQTRRFSIQLQNVPVMSMSKFNKNFLKRQSQNQESLLDNIKGISLQSTQQIQQNMNVSNKQKQFNYLKAFQQQGPNDQQANQSKECLNSYQNTNMTKTNQTNTDYTNLLNWQMERVFTDIMLNKYIDIYFENSKNFQWYRNEWNYSNIIQKINQVYDKQRKKNPNYQKITEFKKQRQSFYNGNLPSKEKSQKQNKIKTFDIFG